MDTLQTALHWFHKGIVPIPLYPRQKLPMLGWKYWQYNFPNEFIIRNWFENKDCNIGLVCGGKQHLVVVDFDEIEPALLWQSQTEQEDTVWGEIARTGYRVQTPRGMHYYVFSTIPVMSYKIVSRCIDIKAEKGIVVIPPSIHPSGVQYIGIGNTDNIYTVSDIEQVFKRDILPTDGNRVCDITTQFESIMEENEGITIQKIKSALSVLDYSRWFTHMQSMGRYWWGRCIAPNHEDRHPSYHVDTVNNVASCESGTCILHSSLGLDIIDLHMLIYNLPNKTTALHDLAARLGME